MKLYNFFKKTVNSKNHKAVLILQLTAIISLALVIILSLSSCINLRFRDLAGSGQVTSRDYTVSGFDSLAFTGIGKIIITQGNSESLKVEAEDNIIDNINVKVSGNQLEIGLKNKTLRVIPTRQITFYLEVRDLKKLGMSGAGIVECPNLETTSLAIDSSGLGSMDLNINAGSLAVVLSGTGKIQVSGKVTSQDIKISGAGSYEAANLSSDNCKINISGLGKASINAVKSLDIVLNGLGSVEYSGNPTVTQHISGGGSIKSVE